MVGVVATLPNCSDNRSWQDDFGAKETDQSSRFGVLVAVVDAGDVDTHRLFVGRLDAAFELVCFGNDNQAAC